MVLCASGQKSGDRDGALSALCECYWPPLYGFVRAKGHSKQDAEDIVQGYFAKLLRNNNIASVDAAHGKLRSFFLSSMRNFLASDYRARSAAKRGGGDCPISLDLEDAERLVPVDPSPDPEQAYTRGWALTVLATVHDQLRTEYTEKGDGEVFATLGDYVTETGTGIPYPVLARQLDVAPGTIKVRVFRLRNRYRARLRDEVARGLDAPDEAAIDDELRFLTLALRGG